MNKLDKQYTDLLQDILDNGVKKQDRTGTGTISVFGRQIRHDMKDGFPLLTTKKMPFKTIVTELLWFLRGDTNIKYLVDNNCHIWDGDAFKNYVNIYKGNFPMDMEEFIDAIKTNDEFANKWGELGPIYGKQWRGWVNYQPQDYTMESGLNAVRTVKTQIDQIQNLINDLKTNPDSRRLMVNAWNVGELGQMVLPPCHYGFQVYTRELSYDEKVDYARSLYGKEDWWNVNDKRVIEILQSDKRAISLMWNQRSVDTGLGLPFNIASYGLLLTMLSEEVNMVPDQLIGNLGDVHLYSNHVEPIKEQIGRDLTTEERKQIFETKEYDGLGIPTRTRTPFPLPKVTINPNNKMRIGGGIFTYDVGDFTLEDYVSHPTIKLPLSN